MSSTSTTAHSSASSSAYRVNYSDYVADITGNSPKTTRKLATTTAGIGHHINPLHNPYPARDTTPAKPASGMPHYGGGAEKCARCLKSVYLAERKVGAGRAFHSSCFSCHKCHRKLDASTLTEHKGEIYCRTCYTRQFGAHGLISGVTMSTEKTSHETRYTRRSSFGNDLDAPMSPFQPPRRSNSSENLLHDSHYGGTSKTDTASRSSRHIEIAPAQHASSVGKSKGSSTFVDTPHQRPSSPVRFEPTTKENHQRYSHMDDSDRQKYITHGEKMSYSHATAALTQMPIVVPPKQSNGALDRMEMPTMPSRDTQRDRNRSPSPSPSQSSMDSYRRQNSSERQLGLTDNYPRAVIRDDPNNLHQRKYSTDSAINSIVPEKRSSTHNYHQSSSSEANYRMSTSNTNNYPYDRSHSRDRSPSPTNSGHRSPSPSTGYVSSISPRPPSTTYSGSAFRPLASPTATHTRPLASPTATYTRPPIYHDIPITIERTPIDRRSASPKPTDRNSSAMNGFMSATTLTANTSTSTGGQFSTLGALVRPQHDDHSRDTRFNY